MTQKLMLNCISLILRNCVVMAGYGITNESKIELMQEV